MLTVKEILAIKPGQAISDGGRRGSGALWFKAGRTGTVSCVFRYSVNRRVIDMSLGPYDVKGQDGMTLDEARNAAGELQRLIQSGIPDPRAYLEEQERAKAEAEEAARKAQEAAVAAAKAEAEARERYTLRKLCETYAGYLSGRGKVRSAKHCMSVFTVHVFKADPDLADKPAREITRRDITGLIRRCNEKGHVRVGGVLRSYLSAAYALAANAEGNALAPSELLGFGIEVNVAAGVQAVPVRVGERTLTKDEMKAYLSRVFGDDLTSRFLLLHLLAGGQRVSQLLRLRVNDYDRDEGSLRLWDSKGRRQAAREHVIQLGPLACELIEVLIDRAKTEAILRANKTMTALDPNPSLWASVGGTVMSISTPGKLVGEIAADMKGESFDCRDIRRSCETLLAGMGVSKDLRGQMLSHGLNSIQDRVYDRHGYTEEKRRAFQRWEEALASMLEEEKATTNVVQLRRRRRA